MPFASPTLAPSCGNQKYLLTFPKICGMGVGVGGKVTARESHCLERQAHTPVPVEHFLEHSKTRALE